MAEQQLKTIIITGSNKGIGFGVAQVLAGKPYKIIMACRSVDRANDARDSILKIHPAAQIDVLALDIDSSPSIDAFVAQIAKKYGQVDVLLNNSGRGSAGPNNNGIEEIQKIFKTNFYGTIEISEKMLPFIRPSGKLIIVGSEIGALSLIKSKNLLARYTNPNITKQDLLTLAGEFKGNTPEGTYNDNSYLPYSMSKLNINTFVKILAKYPEVQKKQIQVYGCTPGWVRTELGGPHAPRSLEEGITCPIYMVELPFKVNPEFQGKFFYDQVPFAF